MAHLDTLLDRMTVAEQAALLAGADFWTTVPVPRLEVPAYKVSDGPNGARGGSFVGGVQTACFPVGIGLAATWNTGLIEQVGAALAAEARLKGAGVLLAPTVNLHRGTLNGRNFECYSEDPWLTGELAVAYIRGLQGQGVAATIKHFVGNESEFERMTMSSEIPERALRELYLVPFEKAVKEAGVWAVMAAYNRIDGVYACDHQRLIDDVLRRQWGFDGLVMSDWMALHSTVEGVVAGCDLEMPGPAVHRGALLVKAAEEGRIEATAIRAAAKNVLRLGERVGAFTSPGIPQERAVDLPANRALIRQLGAEGCVLLKNDGGLLPIRPAGTLALIGPNAQTAQIMGGGSSIVNALHRITPYEGIAAQAGAGATLRHAAGADNHRWVPVLAEPMHVAFFNSADLSGPEVQRKTYPRTEQMWAGAVEPGVSTDTFSARATVAYTVPEDGNYQISLVSAGLSRCLLDGELIVDAWSGWATGQTYFTFGCEEVVATRTLRAGQRCVFTLEFSSASPNPAPFRALRFGVYRPRGEAELAAAVEAARGADAALVFVGLNGEWDNEGLDRPNIELPLGQNELVRRVAAVNPNTIVVLQTGAPVTMPWLADVRAVLQAWYPGQECGHAIADVLFGAAEPGGRLPQTFPQRLADDPTHGNALHYPGVDGRVVYAEGVFIGYRHADRAGLEPLFPFGHGLSYTRFEHGGLRLSAATLAPGGTLQVSLDVKNTGARRGQEVVQLYVHDRRASVERPAQELKAFAKVAPEPGESRSVALTLDMRSLAYYDDARAAWVAEAGEFELRVGASSRDIRQRAAFSLSADWVQPVAAR